MWLLMLPFGRTLADAERGSGWGNALRRFIDRLHPQATLAILTTAPDAAWLWPHIQDLLRFQLWVSIKLAQPLLVHEQLPNHHAALLVLTKYRATLRHTKTRIGYTYCPACDKTTKDYGGKKHLYNSYGTLLSDVWRDISFDPAAFPKAIVGRLSDLFGIRPYGRLKVVDLRKAGGLKPRRPAIQPLALEQGPTSVASAIGDSKLIQADCLTALADVPSESVDFCFADPPYNLEKKYDACHDARELSDYFAWCDRWLDQLARVLKPGRTCAVLNIPQWCIQHFMHLQLILNYQCWIVWEGLSLPVRMIMPANYGILCFSKGRSRPMPGLSLNAKDRRGSETMVSLKEFCCVRSTCIKNRQARGIEDSSPLTDLWWDIHRLKHNSRRVDHPCQLPAPLMRRLIALFSEEGEIVLDPFNGAGTTSLAAEQLGRRFIGIELSEKYHSLAMHRHEELRAGCDPFAKADGVPAAKNSRVRRLKKQRYAVSKKVLQLEVRQIATQLGRMPTRGDVERMSKYSLSYFDQYFLNWGEVCAAARTNGMSETRPGSEPPRLEDQPLLFPDMMELE